MSADFEFTIKSNADLKAAKALEETLIKQAEELRKLGQDASVVEKQIKKVHDSIAAKGGGGFLETAKEQAKELLNEIPGFEKFHGVLTKLASGPLGWIAAGFGAVAAGAEIAKESIQEFAKSERVIAQLDAALAQTGNLTEETRKKFQELAEELQSNTSVEGENWIKVMTKLTQFGAEPDKIQVYTEAVKNLAGILGGDLDTAANLVARALQGNYEAFGRFGIRVEEAGTKAERTQKLFEQLALRGGGQLEAMSKTLTGQFSRLHLAIDDVFKGIGRMESDGGNASGFITSLAVAVEYLSNRVSETTAKQKSLHNALIPTTEEVSDSEKVTKKYADELERMASASDQATSALRRQLDAVTALQHAQDEMTDSKMALDLAKIDRLEAQKAIRPDVAKEARLKIRTESEVERTRNADTADDAKIQLHTSAMEKKATQVIEANQAVAALEAKQKAETERYNKLSDELSPLEKQRQHWERNRDAFNAAPYSFSNPEIGLEPGPSTFGKISAEIQKRLDDVEAKILEKSKEGKGSRESSVDRALAIKLAKENAEKVTKASMDDIEAEREIVTKIQQDKALRRQTSRIRVETDFIKSNSEIESAQKDGTQTTYPDAHYGLDRNGRLVPMSDAGKHPATVYGNNQIPSIVDQEFAGVPVPHAPRFPQRSSASEDVPEGLQYHSQRRQGNGTNPFQAAETLIDDMAREHKQNFELFAEAIRTIRRKHAVDHQLLTELHAREGNDYR